MHLVAAGLSFRSAPISVRERAVVPESEANRLLRYLVGHCGLRGAAVLSTCNRTEFYVSCPTDALADEVRPRLAMYLDPVDDSEVGEHLFELRDAEAIRHMLRVAGGLESMVVGEEQVLGQFRDAHQLAREAGTLDARLDYVMRRAVSAGKRVRTETRARPPRRLDRRRGRHGRARGRRRPARSRRARARRRHHERARRGAHARGRRAADDRVARRRVGGGAGHAPPRRRGGGHRPAGRRRATSTW